MGRCRWRHRHGRHFRPCPGAARRRGLRRTAGGGARALAQNEDAAVVESVKAASEVYAPLTGEVVEINEMLTEDPAQVNADPYGAGWFMRLRIDDPSELDELMDEEGYKEFLADLE